jgi:hypothetical protein
MKGFNIRTIVGNRVYLPKAINLDETPSYALRARTHKCKIDIEKPPCFSSEEVFNARYCKEKCGGDEFEEGKKEKESCILTLKPTRVGKGNTTLVIESFFISSNDKNTRVDWKEVFTHKHLIDVTPRLLFATWDREQTKLELLNHAGRNFTMFSWKTDFKRRCCVQECSCGMGTDLYHVFKYDHIPQKKRFDEILSPPLPREGESLYILFRIYYECCYVPFLFEEFPKEHLSEEQLVWAADEFNVEEKGLSRLQLWGKTKEKLMEECYPKEVFGIPEVMALLFCVFEYDPEHSLLGKDRIQKEIFLFIMGECIPIKVYLKGCLNFLIDARTQRLL